MVGGPCVSYSMMGKRMKAAAPIVKTHRRWFKNLCRVFDAFGWENVTEYELKLMRQCLGAGWSVESVCIDPQCFGLPASRARLYALAWRKDVIEWHPEVPCFKDLIKCLCAQCSTSFTCHNYWWMNPASANTKLSASEARPNIFFILISQNQVPEP